MIFPPDIALAMITGQTLRVFLLRTLITTTILILAMPALGAQQGLGVDRHSFRDQTDYYTERIFAFEDSPLLNGTPRLLGLAPGLILEATGPEHNLSKVSLIVQYANYEEWHTIVMASLIHIISPDWNEGWEFLSTGLEQIADGLTTYASANYQGIQFELKLYQAQATLVLKIISE